MNTPYIPDDILKAFEEAPEITAAGIERLAKANRELDEDPVFLADLQKAMVVSQLRQALNDRDESQSAFASRWGKSRQYVSKFFSDKLKNFTIDTITQAAVKLGLRVTVKVHRVDQEVFVKARSNRASAGVVIAKAVPLKDAQFLSIAPAPTSTTISAYLTEEKTFPASHGSYCERPLAA